MPAYFGMVMNGERYFSPQNGVVTAHVYQRNHDPLEIPKREALFKQSIKINELCEAYGCYIRRNMF